MTKSTLDFHVKRSNQFFTRDIVSFPKLSELPSLPIYLTLIVTKHKEWLWSVWYSWRTSIIRVSFPTTFTVSTIVLILYFEYEKNEMYGGRSDYIIYRLVGFTILSIVNTLFFLSCRLHLTNRIICLLCPHYLSLWDTTPKFNILKVTH